MNRRTRNRLFAVAVGICLLLTVCLSTAFVAKHLGHDCHDVQCAICAQLDSAERRLGQLTLVLLVGLFALASRDLSGAAPLGARRFAVQLNPVSIKVRMNN